MITLEKFFNALEKTKTAGRSSPGLIISSGQAVNFSGLKKEVEKVKISGTSVLSQIIKKIAKANAGKKWLILEIKNDLAPGLFNQLKLLSTQNRLQSPDGEVVRLTDETRVIVLTDRETLKAIEKKYPDFKYLFGPIINV